MFTLPSRLGAAVSYWLSYTPVVCPRQNHPSSIRQLFLCSEDDGTFVLPKCRQLCIKLQEICNIHYGHRTRPKASQVRAVSKKNSNLLNRAVTIQHKRSRQWRCVAATFSSNLTPARSRHISRSSSTCGTLNISPVPIESFANWNKLLDRRASFTTSLYHVVSHRTVLLGGHEELE
jgi:hypothetical protein